MQTLFTGLKKISMTAVLAASLAAGVPAISQATPILKYKIGSVVQTVTGTSGLVSTGLATSGNILFSFSGFSKPAYGSAAKPMIDLFSMSLRNKGTSSTSVEVWLTDIGFSGHTTPLGLWSTYGGTQSGGATVRFRSYADTSNAQFGTGTLLHDSGSLNSAAFSGSSYSHFTNTFTSPFSLTLYTKFELGAKTSITSADQGISVPEPSALGMVGLGLLMVGLMGLRFRQVRYHGDRSEA